MVRPVITAAVAATILFAAGDAVAQECFPECRDGFDCVDGACVEKEAACFPECRDGYQCQKGTCVEQVRECVPACRAGYTCKRGSCEPTSTGTEIRFRQPRKPKAPPKPPRYQVIVNAAFPSTFFRFDYPDMPDVGKTLRGRTVAAGVEVMFREGKATSNGWFAIGLGFGLVGEHDQDAGGGYSQGDDAGLQIKLMQVFKIPMGDPGYGLQLDRKVSVDIGFGGYYITSDESDFGVLGHARLSFYWLHAGPEISFGRSLLSVGLGGGAHVDF